MELKLFSGISFSMADMIAMFGLLPEELNLKILHAQAGPSLFAKEMLDANHSVIACDALYQKSQDQIKSDIDRAIEELAQDLSAHPYQYAQVSKAQQLIADSKNNIPIFFADFESGLKEGRYVPALMHQLPFKDEQFELALVSHCLFTHTEHLSLDFHVKAIQELTRVANEVRVFPLVTEKASLSPHLGNVIAKLQSIGLNEEIRIVPFELQKKGNAMLRVWSKSCSLAAHQPS